MESDTSLNMASLSSMLARRDYSRVLQALQDSSNNAFIRGSVLEIVPEIGGILAGGEDNSVSTAYVKDNSIDFCLEAFKILTRKAKIKELLMAFLEQMDILPSDVSFHVLLYPMQAALLQLSPYNLHKTLEWVFEAIHNQIWRLPVPENHGLEGQEQLLLDSDPDVTRIQTAIVSCIDFCRPFVKDVSLWLPAGYLESQTPNPPTIASLHRSVLAAFFLRLLDKPLALVDLTQQDSRTKSPLRSVAELLVANLCEVEANFCCIPAGRTSASEKPPLALANFSYLIHAEEVCKFWLPCVYSHGYTLKINLPSIVNLLKHDHDLAFKKGLLLLNGLLQYVRAASIAQTSIDIDSYEAVAQGIVDGMVFCTSEECRSSALSVFVKFVEKLDDHGRYWILYQLLGTTNHAGVKAFLVQIFKSNVVTALRQKPPPDSFCGKSLEPMFRRIFTLAEGPQTDLLADCERILEALNFCRYLMMIDPPAEDKTGIWDFLQSLEDNFLKPLQTGLDLSKAHFELELRTSKESIACGEGGDNDGGSPLSVTVDGRPLSPVSHTHKISVLEKSILGLELMQSILSIVNDIVASKKQSSKKDPV